MYDTLQPDLITATPTQRAMMKQDPTYVVEKSMFLQNSFPYLEVRRPFILGTQKQRWKATIAHRFAELLHVKTDKLARVYTQNIDGLDGQCDGIPEEKIVSVHGTISRASCEVCKTVVEFDEFCKDVKKNIRDIYSHDADGGAPSKSTPILCPSCGRATVKPDTVLFGSSLPMEFFERTEEDLPQLDLLLVVGTSLLVSPANGLVRGVRDDCIRVVVNRDAVGTELGIQYAPNGGFVHGRDCFARGNCEQIFLELIQYLGWMDDLKLIAHKLPESSRALLTEYG